MFVIIADRGRYGLMKIFMMVGGWLARQE